MKQTLEQTLAVAKAIERADFIPVGKAGNRLEITGYPGCLLLRGVNRLKREQYRYIAVHTYNCNSGVSDHRRHLTFHSRRDLCKPKYPGDEVLKVIEIESPAFQSDHNQTEENTTMTKITETTTDNVAAPELTKRQLATAFNALARLHQNLLGPAVGINEIKSFRDIETGRRRLEWIRQELKDLYGGMIQIACDRAMDIVKGGEVAKAEALVGDKPVQTVAIRDYESMLKIRHLWLDHTMEEISVVTVIDPAEEIKPRSWKVSTWELTEEQQKELNKTAKGGRQRKTKKASGSTSQTPKRQRKPAENKYTRGDALVEALQTLGSAEKKQIVQLSNDLYVKAGNEENPKLANWKFVVSIDVLLKVGAVSREGAVYKYNNG